MKTTKTGAEAYLISRDRMEGMLETLEIVANPAAMKAIARDRKGRTTYHALDVLDGIGAPAGLPNVFRRAQRNSALTRHPKPDT